MYLSLGNINNDMNACVSDSLCCDWSGVTSGRTGPSVGGACVPV